MPGNGRKAVEPNSTICTDRNLSTWKPGPSSARRPPISTRDRPLTNWGEALRRDPQSCKQSRSLNRPGGKWAFRAEFSPDCAGLLAEKHLYRQSGRPSAGRIAEVGVCPMPVRSKSDPEARFPPRMRHCSKTCKTRLWHICSASPGVFFSFVLPRIRAPCNGDATHTWLCRVLNEGRTSRKTARAKGPNNKWARVLCCFWTHVGLESPSVVGGTAKSTKQPNNQIGERPVLFLDTFRARIVMRSSAEPQNTKTTIVQSFVFAN